jgi:hypothetical protein
MEGEDITPQLERMRKEVLRMESVTRSALLNLMDSESENLQDQIFAENLQDQDL